MLQVSAGTKAQKINLKRSSINIASIFKEVRRQTGYSVIWKSKELNASKRLSVAFVNASLAEVLRTCINDKNLEYLINEKTIIIKEKEPGIFDIFKTTISTAFDDIQGRILDEQGKPLPGATITIKGTKQSVISQQNGTFRMLGVDKAAILVVSYTGYETIYVKASDHIRDIVMKTTNSELDQVQVIGYGTTTKRFNTGSVATVKGGDIQNQSVSSPLQALQGMVPGLFIQQGSGMPGASSQVALRGKNSITSGTVPLYIIDGVPFDGNPVEQSGDIYTSEQGNGSSDPLNAINPKDIESIEVLKDADATSIYGARGANGVIIITTKYAKSGATTLSGTVFTGMSKIRKYPSSLGTADYLALRKAAFANDNITPTAINAPDLVLWDQNGDTDYQKYLLGNTAPQTEANIALSGGNSNNGLYLSGSYRNEGTVYPADFGYRRGSLHGKAFHTSDNGKLRAEISTIYSSDLNRMPATDLTNTTTTYPNNYPLYNPDGTLYFHPAFSTNPIALLRNYGKNTSKTFVINAALQYNILSNLRLKVNVGQNSVSQDAIAIYPGSARNPSLGSISGGGGSYTNNTNNTYLAEPQLDYNTVLGKGKLNATLGGTYQFRENKQPYYVSAGMFSSDALLENYSSAGMIYYQTSSSSQYRFASVFGRAVYNWDSKYILSGTFRRDGSSRFGPGKQFGTFGSLGAAWLFTEEPFLKNTEWLSFGKLRASYGTVGNDQIRNYGYLETYGSTGTPYGNNPGILPSGIANDDYSWETTRKMELALELGFFNDKLMLNTAWFRNRSGNLLSYYPLSGQTGFTGYTANLDALVQNEGWEFELRATPINKNSFSWNAAFNISTSVNKLLAYPGLSGSSYASRYAIGYSLNSMTLYQFAGFENGIAQVADLDGDGQISPGLKVNGMGDYIIAGSTDPKFYGGFSNNFKVGNFQLDVFMNFVKKDGLSPTSFPGLIANQIEGVMDRRFTPSTSTGSASYASYENYYVNSSAKVVDASFIRLRNVTLSYNLPEKWISKANIRNCRIFATGQNLLTITSYKGFDPETLQYNPVGFPMPLPAPVFPPLLAITGGIQFSL
ncbi:putative outer membrane protein [Pedobacter sp. BAL39]|nr:putative outer membrane protein [Pedobacter sp. BAL39]